MHSPTSVLYGDRVALQCEQHASGFLAAHSTADPTVVVSTVGELALPKNFERCVLSVERVTSWSSSAKPEGTDAEDEPIAFGHFVRIKHHGAGAFIGAHRVRKSADNAPGYLVRLATEHERYDASTVWRIVSKYKIRQEGEKVAAGDHVVLQHDQLQLSLTLSDTRTQAAAVDGSKLQLTLAAASTSFSFVVNEPRAVARSKHIHSGRCLLLFHKEQEAFLTLTDAATAQGQTSRTSSPTRVSFASRPQDRKLCLMYPRIRASTYNIGSLSYSSNSLWMLETPDVLSSHVAQIAPSTYRVKHLASGFYLSVTDADQRTISLSADIDSSSRDPSQPDHTLWMLSPASDGGSVVESASTFFRITSYSTGLWIQVTLSMGDVRSPHDTPVARAASPRSRSRSLSTSSKPPEPFGMTLDSGSDSDSDGPSPALALPPREAREVIHSENTPPKLSAADEAASPSPSGGGPAAPRESYSDFIGFALQTSESVSEAGGGRATAVSLAERPSYVDVFCAVSVPESVSRNLATVLGHSECFSRFLRVMRSGSREDNLPRVLTLAQQCTSSLRDLIPFCTVSEVADHREREGLPIRENQRVLVDQQLHLKAIEVLFAPVAGPLTSIGDLRDNAFVTTGAMLSWQTLGAAINHLGHMMHNICALACRFLKLVTKGNPEAARQLQPFLPALLHFFEPVPEVCGVFSEVVRCVSLTPPVARQICGAVLDLDLDVLAEHRSHVDLLHDLCFTASAPNPDLRDVVVRSLTEVGQGIVPQFSIVGGQVNACCPTAMHGDTRFLPLATFCGSPRNTAFLASSIHLLAAITGPTDTASVLPPDFVSLALEASLPSAVRCALIRYANSVAAMISIPGALLSDGDDSLLLPWDEPPPGQSTRDAAFEALKSQILTIFARTVEGCVPAAAEDDKTGGPPVDHDERRKQVLGHSMSLLNACLSFCITCASMGRFSDAEASELSANVYTLIDLLPTPSEAPELRAWSELSVRFMESVHHATELLCALIQQDARTVARKLVRTFTQNVNRGPLKDDDDDENALREALSESVIGQLRDQSKNSTLQQTSHLQRLIDLSTYEHAALPNDTLKLAFLILSPASAVRDELSGTVLNFAAGPTSLALSKRFAACLQNARELLSVPVLTHLHTDSNARSLHRSELSRAIKDCLDVAMSMPEDLLPLGRNIFLGFGVYPLLLQELDTADQLASATFEGEADQGTVVMRALRLLLWFVSGDDDANAAAIMPHFTVLGRLARCSPIFLSQEYSDIMRIMLTQPTESGLEVSVLVESIVSDIAQLSTSHLDLITLIAEKTNEQTRAKMRSALASAVGSAGEGFLEGAEANLAAVLRAIAVTPSNQAEASNLAGAMPFDQLLSILSRREPTQELFVAAARALTQLHLLPATNMLIEEPDISVDDAVALRDTIIPYISSHMFGPRYAPGSGRRRDATDVSVAAVFSNLVIKLPSVGTHHRLLAGCAADLATTVSQYTTSLFDVEDDRRIATALPELVDALAKLLGTLEDFLRPRPPAIIATPLYMLKQAISSRDKHEPAAAAAETTAEPAATDGAGGEVVDERAITLRWQWLTQAIDQASNEPTGEELEPLIEIYEQQPTATQAQAGQPHSSGPLEVVIRHLRHSTIAEWVTVALLSSLKAMLANANDESEAAMIATQDRLNSLEATPLISVLLECPSMVIVQHAVQMGIALLEGGNKKCQDALLRYFSTHDEKFFLTFRKILKEAEASVSHRIKTLCDDLIVPDSPASLVEDLLRLLQLLCEGHHFEFQNYVRHQHDNFNTYNMCVTVMELLHTVLLVLDDTTVPVVSQALNTLTELCQGPCAANQEAIVGCNIVTEVNRLLTNNFEGEVEADDLRGLKSAAIICLSSLLEGSQDATIPNLMLTNLELPALADLLAEAWEGREEEEMVDLGFQLYILAGTLITQGDRAKTEKLRQMLNSAPGNAYFSGNLCCIEVWRDDDPTFTRLESVFFRKPDICKLRDETKEVVLNKVNRSSIVSKHSDFVRLADDLIFEMEHQYAIESFASTKPMWMNPFGLLKARPRPVEDALLFASFALNANLLLGGNESTTMLLTASLLGFFVVLAASYLIAVRFVLLTPLVAHRNFKRDAKKRSGEEEDPFLTLPSMREKLAFVANKKNLMVVCDDPSLQMYAACWLLGILGVLFSSFFHSFLLILVIHKFPLLGNIVKAITMNGRQLLLTAFLGVVVIYFFSVVGFLFFPSHFAKEDGDNINNNCESLLQCFFYSFSKGLRGGGGISEAMVDNEWYSSTYYFREAYDTLYFVVVAVIVMNIVFALIVDTFAELRDARKRIEEDMVTTCFICGIDAATFDRSGEGFTAHTKGAHNMWQYLYFMHHLRRKEKSEFTGQESYVYAKLSKNDLSFFPVNRSKSLENAKSLLPDEDESSGPSLADIRKLIEDVVSKQLTDAFQKHASTMQQKGAGSGADDAAVAASSSGSLWGVARARSMNVLRRPGAAGGQPAADGAAGAPSKMGLADVAARALAQQRDADAAAADMPRPLGKQRSDAMRVKQETQELLELLRSAGASTN